MRLSFRTLQRGNAGRDALRRKEDAERPERHADAERRTITAQNIGTIVEVIVPHAPAWECRSRRSASQRGREASGTACRRGASHDHCVEHGHDRR
ncbi:DUF1534 domain-containing protein [Pseudomonas syringae]|uniref:DUF1534 domain-containing protein n=1 Tax=Pseudomonas syringae TaxID=317 RepID=A0A9Q4A8V7_PSESX|nr:DUF1534 domain-containing protein [Pseudomonas syringae]MCF5484321.1 DUF1534 domain-containing protein [Pseudomonas syringae]MCF5499373.1 DUF1534 domain-containing protein [Pseudomonas syringae]MCF5520540.1 DUF1534 domain-containing protein [Pseudomonas syringae]MCF5530256.1 DUF1534 domain-containing protein [Pseudomonas syringae]